jgi:hypothetical protein
MACAICERIRMILSTSTSHAEVGSAELDLRAHQQAHQQEIEGLLRDLARRYLQLAQQAPPSA